MAYSEYEKEMAELYARSLGIKQQFKGIVCPRSFKKPCRLCDLCLEVLFNRQIPKEAPLRKKASSLNAKMHYFSNIIFIADPITVIVFEYGDKIFKQLLAMQMDETNPIWQNFWHPMTGRNLLIRREQGASRDQVDYYVNPKDQSKLSHPEILAELKKEKYNLSNIATLVEAGEVKPLFQSKLDKLVEIRVLPSWLGPENAKKFFQKVDYHFNISEEDFKATQAGEINPVRIGYEETSKQQPTTHSITESTPRVEEVKPIVRKEEPKSEWDAYMNPIAAAPVANVKETSVPMADDDELPPCYGDYDPSDKDCTTKCKDELGWMEGCIAFQKAEAEKIKQKRMLAKRLTR